jgi:protein TonB
MKTELKNNQKTQKGRLRSVSFLVISLLLHLFLLLGFYLPQFLFENDEPVTKIEKTPEIQFIDISALDEKGRLVEQAEDEKPTEKPKDAKFVSKVDKAVEKETRAARHGEFQNKQSQESQAATSQQFAQPPPASAQDQATATAPEESVTEEIKTFESGDMPVAQKQQEPVKKKAKTVADLRPNTMQEMSQSSMVSQTSDYLKDVAIGAETHLNTREFLYYSYFNRIKKKLRQHWEPLVHAKVRSMVKRGREIASTGSLATRVIITLDESGQLRRVQVSTTSGLEDLDDAAVEALQEAAQFPNPPKDLVREGFVTLNWDFILES